MSCERVFDPRVLGKPAIVLSSNDGCAVARSQEAKKLGIAMGAPFFKIKDLVRKNNVHVFSANFSLYSDMSHRVMETLSQFSDEMEIYSIDEAFLWFEDCANDNHQSLGKRIKETVKLWTGIPVSVGFGKTKTLAKLAAEVAKKDENCGGVFCMQSENSEIVLKNFPVEDVWGIGRKRAAKLRLFDIHSAYDFAYASDEWIRKKFTIGGLKTAWELRGISCAELDGGDEGRKSIICSRSFGDPIMKKEHLEEAISEYAVRAAEKLRNQNSVASHITVFLNTNRFAKEYYSNAHTLRLETPSAYAPDFIALAKNALEKIFIPDLQYKRAGVCIMGIEDADRLQQNLFCSQIHNEKKKNIMRVVDRINSKMGHGMVQFAAEGLNKKWGVRRQHSSQEYTTNWNQLLKIRV